jgi:Peptidase family M1 domain
MMRGTVTVRFGHTFQVSQSNPSSSVQYFHNWTGNRVTCRDWFQLTLKEGLTVFRDQEFSGDMNSKAVNRIENVRALRARQFAEDAGPMSHPIRPESYVVRTLACLTQASRCAFAKVLPSTVSPNTHLARWAGDGQFLHSRKSRALSCYNVLLPDEIHVFSHLLLACWLVRPSTARVPRSFGCTRPF